MAKSKYTRGNMHRADYARALVTDTLPAEVPIIFSNDGFYKNQKRRNLFSDDTKQILNCILNPLEKSYSVPYRYRITKDETSTRRLSLLHPRSQIEICEFYRKYEELICYYNSQSKFSIRAPQKIGSSFFFTCGVSEKNKYKGAPIDTLQFEKRLRNPASFFSYDGYTRLHKFFDSSRFLRLEKKFSNMWFADVSKCFDSIYTHTLPWAVKDMPISKNSISYKTFGSSFDKLMQRQNYNETNGICIGPELSRIFAETIFQKIDNIVLLRAKNEGLRNKSDYECVRYVDDIIIFSNDPVVSGKIYALFEEALGEFNLHLNSLKLEKHTRPFQTNQSQLIKSLENDFAKLESALLEKIKTDDGTFFIPAYIYKSSALKIDFIKSVKATCYDAEVGYSMASNYLIACLSNFLERLVEKNPETPADIRPSNERYIGLVNMVLELIFFLYTVQPSVNTSFRLSKAVVLSIKFLNKLDAKRAVFTGELLTQWTYELVNSFERNNPDLSSSKIPVELLNVFLAIGEGDTVDHFTADFVDRTILRSKKPDYFSIISFLFFTKKLAKFADLRTSVEDYLLSYFNDKAQVLKYARDAHLFLDICSCPHLSVSFRSKVIKAVNTQLELPTMSFARCEAIASELEGEAWFTNWNEVDLLNMIKRKELSAVY